MGKYLEFLYWTLGIGVILFTAGLFLYTILGAWALIPGALIVITVAEHAYAELKRNPEKVQSRGKSAI